MEFLLAITFESALLTAIGTLAGVVTVLFGLLLKSWNDRFKEKDKHIKYYAELQEKTHTAIKSLEDMFKMYRSNLNDE